jgi:hypothetical protein
MHTRPLKITATEDVPGDALEEFQSALASDYRLSLEEGRLVFKSLDAPSWVRLIAELEWWQQALSAAAALYVAEIVKEAAKETWKSRAKLVAAAVKSAVGIKNLAVRVTYLKTRLAARTEVIVGLPQPSDYFGTHLAITPEEGLAVVELELSLFVHYLPAVAKLVVDRKARGASAATGYFLEIQPNADLLVWWFDGVTLKRNEALISLRHDEV